MEILPRDPLNTLFMYKQSPSRQWDKKRRSETGSAQNLQHFLLEISVNKIEARNLLSGVWGSRCAGGPWDSVRDKGASASASLSQSHRHGGITGFPGGGACHRGES